MSKQRHIDFLKAHQPLPDDQNADDALFHELEAARKFFAEELDEQAVPMLIGSLGNGDGHGVYSMVETTLMAYPDDVVIRALRDGLNSDHASVRYWSAQFSANYPESGLLEELVAAYRRGDVDTKIAAITAIESIGTKEAVDQLTALLENERAGPVAQMIRDAIVSSQF
jgi:HEAT repeat protein